MPKSDFDALLVHLFLRYTNKRFDSFDLSKLFRIRESRLKTLIASAGVKFEERSEQEIWMEILGKWKDSLTEVESIEKGHVTFKFENPAFFPFVQKEVRKLGATVTYSPGSEVVTMSLSTLFQTLDVVYKQVFEKKQGHQYLIEDLLKKIKTDLIGENELTKIRADKEKKLKLTDVLTNAQKLASIGGFITKIFFGVG
jgi:hypothetical protein